MIVFVILAIILFFIGYTLFNKCNEGLTSTPTPHAIPIPDSVKDMSVCDYPLIWQGILSTEDITLEELKEFFPQYSNNVITEVCNPSNPQNLTNQTEICSIFNNLSNAYHNVVAYNEDPNYIINLDSCPVSVYDPSSNGLNESSVCNLYNYAQEAREIEADMRTSGQIPPSQPPIVDNIISILQDKCSDSNPNACIIGNALVGNLPSYCSISTSPVSTSASPYTSSTRPTTRPYTSSSTRPTTRPSTSSSTRPTTRPTTRPSTSSYTTTSKDISNLSALVSTIGNAGF